MELGLFFALVVVALEWHRFKLEKQIKDLNTRIDHFEILAAENHDNISVQAVKLAKLQELEDSFPEVREYMVRVETKLDTVLKEYDDIVDHKFGKIDFVEGL